MEAIKSPVELELMRAIKRLFDPANILNPGKLLPPEGDRP
jgi:FAD/FMN-containing dehydrogenase